MRAAPSADPAVLVVRFRLRLLGHRRWAHAAFRFESLSNTPLVAGHDGFCSKLWMTDEETGVSRGIYQWDGAESATTSVETVRVVLAPWVVPGSFDYRVVADADRARFLEGSWPRRPCHLRAVTRAGGSPRRPTPVAAWTESDRPPARTRRPQVVCDTSPPAQDHRIGSRHGGSRPTRVRDTQVTPNQNRRDAVVARRTLRRASRRPRYGRSRVYGATGRAAACFELSSQRVGTGARHRRHRSRAAHPRPPPHGGVADDLLQSQHQGRPTPSSATPPQR